MQVAVSSPGKLMLLGDHAVVYGYPCLVTAINKKVHVAIEQQNIDSIDLSSISDTRFIQVAIHVVQKAWNVKVYGIKITTQSEFEDISGLGSSAAVTVATIKALAQFFDKKLTNRDIFDLAYHAIVSVQGVGSGFDVAASVYGGVVYYQNKDQVVTIQSLVIRNTDDKKAKLSKAKLSFRHYMPLLVFHTGVKADTAKIVKEVSHKSPKLLKSLMKELGELAEQGKTAYLRGDWQQFGILMNQSQEILHDLDVSSSIIEKLIKAASDAGAYGAKLSGAGRGDCIIALAPEKKRDTIIRAVEKGGGKYIPIKIQNPNVKCQIKSK